MKSITNLESKILQIAGEDIEDLLQFYEFGLDLFKLSKKVQSFVYWNRIHSKTSFI